MAFYAGRIIREQVMENPTIVVITDRNDLDDQLFNNFALCKDLLRQPPVQVASSADLREKLQVESGGVVFTTIQKFFPEEKGDRHPELSKRRNIVVIADEAHRSQYDFIDGFARHMRDALPNASFIGFTGTPIELTDKNTRAVFGDYIRSMTSSGPFEVRATVPIFYVGPPRKARSGRARGDQRLDPNFVEGVLGREIERKEKLKTKWAHSKERGRREADPLDRKGHRGPLSMERLGALEGKAHGGLHEQAYMRRALQRNRQIKAGVG
jgi:type I restriction enzyme R subunit